MMCTLCACIFSDQSLYLGYVPLPATWYRIIWSASLSVLSHRAPYLPVQYPVGTCSTYTFIVTISLARAVWFHSQSVWWGVWHQSPKKLSSAGTNFLFYSRQQIEDQPWHLCIPFQFHITNFMSSKADYYEKGSAEVSEISAVQLKKLAQVCTALNVLEKDSNEWMNLDESKILTKILTF